MADKHTGNEIVKNEEECWKSLKAKYASTSNYKVFKIFDLNKNGIISTDEFKEQMRTELKDLTEDQINMMVKTVDINGNGKIDYGEFMERMNAAEKTVKTVQECWKILKEKYAYTNNNKVFNNFDDNQNGEISADEFKKHIKKELKDLTNKEIDMMVKSVDINDNGIIDYDEFMEKMNEAEYDNGVAHGNGVGHSDKTVKTVEECWKSLKSKNVNRSNNKVFDRFDESQDGIISADEFKKHMKKELEDLTEDEIDMMVKSVDIDGDGFIDYDEFMEKMNAAEKKVKTVQECWKILKEKYAYTNNNKVFDRFDDSQDGIISADEFKKQVKKELKDLTDKEIDMMVKSVDISGDGLIDYDEFMEKMNEAEYDNGVAHGNGVDHSDLTVKNEEECWKILKAKFGYKSNNKIFDNFDDDGDGIISADEFKKHLKTLPDLDLTDKEIDMMVKAADTDGDGDIDYTELMDKLNAAE